MLNSEILVVGGGPAGIAAAVRARESGVSVTVVDDNPAPGGQIWRGEKSGRWLKRFRAAAIPVIAGARVLSNAPGLRTLLIESPEGALAASYRKLILATGARERFLPFPGWTLPGVMGVGGLQALVKSGMPVSGKRIVLAGSGPLLLAAATYLRKHGARVQLIAEQASRGAVVRFGLQLLHRPAKMAQAAALKLALAGIPYLPGCWVEAAEGDGRVERVRLRRRSRQPVQIVDCDYAAIAYGLCPNTELASLLECRIQQHAVTVDELQRTSVDNVFCAGECTGIGGVDLSLVEGEIAGYAAGAQPNRARHLFQRRERARKFASALNAAFALRGELKQLPRPDTIVCRCEDVPFHRLPNMGSFRAAKLQTRCGMGPCQARICGPAVNFFFGWETESIRPPIFPAPLGSLILDTPITEEASLPQ